MKQLIIQTPLSKNVIRMEMGNTAQGLSTVTTSYIKMLYTLPSESQRIQLAANDIIHLIGKHDSFSEVFTDPANIANARMALETDPLCDLRPFAKHTHFGGADERLSLASISDCVEGILQHLSTDANALQIVLWADKTAEYDGQSEAVNIARLLAGKGLSSRIIASCGKVEQAFRYMHESDLSFTTPIEDIRIIDCDTTGVVSIYRSLAAVRICADGILLPADTLVAWKILENTRFDCFVTGSPAFLPEIQTFEAAEEHLKTANHGTLLLRKSRTPGLFCVAFRAFNGTTLQRLLSLDESDGSLWHHSVDSTGKTELIKIDWDERTSFANVLYSYFVLPTRPQSVQSCTLSTSRSFFSVPSTSCADPLIRKAPGSDLVDYLKELSAVSAHINITIKIWKLQTDSLCEISGKVPVIPVIPVRVVGSLFDYNNLIALPSDTSGVRYIPAKATYFDIDQIQPARDVWVALKMLVERARAAEPEPAQSDTSGRIRWI